jgi:hypothetical protein
MGFRDSSVAPKIFGQNNHRQIQQQQHHGAIIKAEEALSYKWGSKEKVGKMFEMLGMEFGRDGV